MTKKVTQFPSFPRAVRPVPSPLALYLRAGRNDHNQLLKLFASGTAACYGVIFDPCQLNRHQELMEDVLARRIDAILDPKTQQSALPGGCSHALGAVPWGVGDRMHQITDFQGTSGRRLINSLSDFVLENAFTQVIAPTHLLVDSSDPWPSVDAESTRRLRDCLNRENGASVPIIYSLAVSYAAFRNKEQRQNLIQTLKSVPMDALWIKVDGFGSDSSASKTINYIQAATDFHELGVPLIADHVGGTVISE